MEPDSCPSADELLAFHRGDLSVADLDRIAAHLEGCGRCEDALQMLDAREGSLAAALRGQETPGPTAEMTIDSAVFRPSTPPGRGEGIGDVIGGRYKLVEAIGEGGMGAVFMAQQTEPVRRLVAIKLIKPGMDSRQVLARFEAERQAVALMDHPNIARVFDAGATDLGRPYFVMELVKGIPITRYCDENRLTPKERLELFVPVCQAIQHAHQKGVIHRDLKPSNILVARLDGRPVPKVIDFGVAKATGEPLTDRTLVTGFGAVVGTPEYMAPEQAELNQLDVDTRVDVYALGVVLYELLTGSTPLTRQRTSRAALIEILRMIREEEPPPPSSRLSTAEALPSIAADRHTEPRRLTALIRGDLDWVVMKALEKDRARRYETASGLGRDIERYLADEPVEAGPPSASYRLRKFARRYRGPLRAAACFAAVLVAATAVSSYLAYRAIIAERQAKNVAGRLAEEKSRTQAALDKALAEEKKAREELGNRTAVQNFFLTTVFAAGRPVGYPGGLGREVTLRKAIDTAAPKIAEAFRDRPDVEAEVRRVLGETYQLLAEPELSLVQREKALGFAARPKDPRDRQALVDKVNLASAMITLRRPKEAITLLEKAVPALTEASGRDDLNVLLANLKLATAYRAAGRFPEALALLTELRRRFETVLGPDHEQTLVCRNELATLYLDMNKPAEAAGLLVEVVAEQKARLGEDSPETLAAEANLGGSYLLSGDYPRAIEVFEKVRAKLARVMGPRNRNTLTVANTLAATYLKSGRAKDAIPLLEEIAPAMSAVFGANDRDTIRQIRWLAEGYMDVGKIEDATTLYQKYFEVQRKVLGPTSPEFSESLAVAGDRLIATRPPAALEPLRECLKIREAADPASWKTSNARALLGGALAGVGELAEAERLLTTGFEEMSARQLQIPENGRFNLRNAADRLARLHEAVGKPQEAARWRAEAAKWPEEPMISTR